MIDFIAQIPNVSEVLAFVIQAFLVVGGLAMLYQLLMGGLEWIVSGGEKEKLGKAQGRMVSAIVGMIVMIGVLTLVQTLEQQVFNERICMGVSCPVRIPTLFQEVR